MSSDLVKRLRGEYRVPITDGHGPAGGDEPDNPKEFVRHFETPPIQKEAAARIKALEGEVAALVEAQETSLEKWAELVQKEQARAEREREIADAEEARRVAAEARAERLRVVLTRCRTVLGNMALENEGAVFKRWPISHEPLRADARHLLPVIDEALEDDKQ